MTTVLLDLKPYTVGASLPTEPATIIANLLGLDPDSFEYSRALFNDPNDGIVEYVLIRDRMNNSWKTYRLDALNKRLKESANVS